MSYGRLKGRGKLLRLDGECFRAETKRKNNKIFKASFNSYKLRLRHAESLYHSRQQRSVYRKRRFSIN